jgi:hypothetical protein
LRAVVGVTAGVGDLDCVRVRGKVGRSPGVFVSGNTGSDGRDCLEITRVAILQRNGNIANSARPGDIKRLVLLNIVIVVGELNSIGKGSQSAEEESSGDLHVDGSDGLGRLNNITGTRVIKRSSVGS